METTPNLQTESAAIEAEKIRREERMCEEYYAAKTKSARECGHCDGGCDGDCAANCEKPNCRACAGDGPSGGPLGRSDCMEQ